MERIVEIVRMEDYCPSCHSKYSIELYDVYNNSLGLTRLLNRNILNDKIENRRLSYMKCKKCGHEYKIDYSYGSVRPLNEEIDISYNNFNEDLNKRKEKLYGKYLFHK